MLLNSLLILGISQNSNVPQKLLGICANVLQIQFHSSVLKCASSLNNLLRILNCVFILFFPVNDN